MRESQLGVESFMRAVVYDNYGPPDFLRLEEVEKPSPKDDEVLIKIHASTVNRLDCHTREANRRSGLAVTLLSRLVSGLRRPRQPILGADVTAVCNTKNLALVKSLGADRVIDYTREDFTKNGETYDVIFDAVGKHLFKRCKDSLNPGGYYLATDGFRNLPLALWTARFGNKKVRFTLPPRYPRQDVVLIKELMETDKYRAVIDRRYPLEEVIEAARYVETEQKTGNVVLALND